MRFRKKPIVIEARPFRSYLDTPDLVAWIERSGGRACCGQQTDGPVEILIYTIEGVMVASVFDWIICGVKGEFYPCKPDIFRATYDPVPDDPDTFRRPMGRRYV